MESSDIGLDRALLQWVNTFPLPKSVTSFEQLHDGLILWQLLQHIEPGFFNDDLKNKEADSVKKKWENRKVLAACVMT
jgi:protein HOOK3